MDQAAYGAAVAVYRERHLHMPDDELATKMSKLIRDAKAAYGQWIHGDDR